MNAIADLFPGFAEHRIRTAGAEIFVRTGGNGPPLLLLHGYPQTHVCWHRIAPELSRHVTLVLADLRAMAPAPLPPATPSTRHTPSAPWPRTA
jgi:haloacetate dehalogenase